MTIWNPGEGVDLCTATANDLGDRGGARSSRGSLLCGAGAEGVRHTFHSISGLVSAIFVFWLFWPFWRRFFYDDQSRDFLGTSHLFPSRPRPPTAIFDCLALFSCLEARGESLAWG